MGKKVILLKIKSNNVHGRCNKKHICKIPDFWTEDFILLFFQPSGAYWEGDVLDWDIQAK